jgi:hypothetical protein
VEGKLDELIIIGASARKTLAKIGGGEDIRVNDNLAEAMRAFIPVCLLAISGNTSPKTLLRYKNKIEHLRSMIDKNFELIAEALNEKLK